MGECKYPQGLSFKIDEFGQIVKAEGAANFCYNCGTRLPLGTKFCPECGNHQSLTKSSANSLFFGKENGFEWVDLGLPVKWASCNIGAYKPEEIGHYFAWGEITPKSEYNYSKDNYSLYKQGWPQKYCVKKVVAWHPLQKVDGRSTLERCDDAASYHWGGNWRMPTIQEIEILIRNCKWEWIPRNGVNGYRITGPSGASIFLPASSDVSLEIGDYWSSSLDISDCDRAGYFYFTKDEVKAVREGSYRWAISTIRAVC